MATCEQCGNQLTEGPAEGTTLCDDCYEDIMQEWAEEQRELEAWYWSTRL